MVKHVGCKAKILFNHYDPKQDFCLNICGAKQDFLFKTFVQNCKTFVSTFKCKSILLFNNYNEKKDFCSNMLGMMSMFQSLCTPKHLAVPGAFPQQCLKICANILGEKQDFCSNILGVKQDFCSKFLMQSKTFVLPLWVQSNT